MSYILCYDKRKNGRSRDFGYCFRKINVYPGETRDEYNKERFFMETFDGVFENPPSEYSIHSFNEVRLVIRNFLIFLIP